MTGEACPFCDHLNPEGSRYCNNCGAALYLRPCPHCGELTETGSVRCRSCGGELRSADGMPLRTGAEMAVALGTAESDERAPPGDALEAAVDAAEAGDAREPTPVEPPESDVPTVGAGDLVPDFVGEGGGRAREADESGDEGVEELAASDAPPPPGRSRSDGAPGGPDAPGPHQIDARDSLREIFSGAARPPAAIAEVHAAGTGPVAPALFELPAPLTGSRRDVAGELQAVAADNERAAQRLGDYAESLAPIEATRRIDGDATAVTDVTEFVPPRRPLRKVGVALVALGLALSGYGIYRGITGVPGDDSHASRSGTIATPGGTPGGSAAASAQAPAEVAPSAGSGGDTAARGADESPATSGAPGNEPRSAGKESAVEIAVPAHPPTAQSPPPSAASTGSETSSAPTRAASDRARESSPRRAPPAGASRASPRPSPAASTARSAQAAASPPSQPTRRPAEPARPCTQAAAVLGLCDPRSVQEAR